MSSNLFVICFESGADEGKKSLEKNNFRFFPLIEETTYLVAGFGTAENIMHKANIKKGSNTSGAVFKLNGSYAGYASPELWQWLNQNDGTKSA
ncbi:MAG: hypothetical protein OXE94_07700 [Aestuariivita sp.]|nr:hypothetical protein [Aestuariivita sp.]MCY4202264.1 hypothetical protein [Aestuariivita sp.]